MKILYVASFVPSANTDHAGGQDIFYLLRSLSERHAVSVICLDKTSRDEDLAALKQFCQSVDVVAPEKRLAARLIDYARWPRSVGMHFSREFDGRLHNLIQEEPFDLVQYENVQMIPYARDIRVPGILDCIDVSFIPLFQEYLSGKGSKLKRIYWLVEWPRLQLYESRQMRQFKGIVVRSQRDAAVVKIIHPQAHIAIMQVRPLDSSQAPASKKPLPPARRGSKIVMFVGAMWRPINSEACIYFIEQIWPKIHRAVPEAEFWVVGSSPPAKLMGFDARDNVRIIGRVESVGDYYDLCSVAVVPLFAAGGVIKKVVDAMSIGLPVVATSAANAGIGAVHNRHILIGDDAESFAEQVIALLCNEDLYLRISEKGRDYIHTNLNWHESVEQIERLYEAVRLGARQDQSLSG